MSISEIILVQIEALEKANALHANKLCDTIEAQQQFTTNCQTMVQLVDTLIKMEQYGLLTGLGKAGAE